VNIGINFASDLMQLQLFCNSTVLYYKHSYSPTGMQFQTPAISYYFGKECNNIR